MQTINSSCPQCDLLLSDFKHEFGLSKFCPRCNCLLSSLSRNPIELAFYYNIAALILFPLVYIFPFLTFNLNGNISSMTFSNSFQALISNGYLSVSIVLSLSLVALPLLFLCISFFIHWQAKKAIKNEKVFHKLNVILLKIISVIRPWLMVDVFFIGILVSLVKVMSIAQISFGPSFWIFIIFTICFTKSLISINISWLWDLTTHNLENFKIDSSYKYASEVDLKLCHTCSYLNDSNDHCKRCGDKIHLRSPNSIQRTLSLTFLAAILYIPANIFPMMYTTFFGETEPSTIISGIILLIKLKSYPVAFIIFIASVIVPLAKILALCWLCYLAKYKKEDTISGTKIYRITEFVGRWSMIDIFVVTLLTALIHLNGIMVVYPGMAAISFAGVVIITMIAAHNFDPRLLWDKGEKNVNRSN